MSSNGPLPRNRRISRYAKSAGAVIIAAMGVFWAFYRQDEEIPVFELYGVLISSLFILFPFLLVVEVVACLNKFLVKPPFQQRITEAVAWLAVIGGSMSLSIVLFVVVARGIIRWNFIVAQSYAVNAMRTLDAIKKQNGTYPTVLPEAELGRLPKYLRFCSDGRSCYFLYLDEDDEGIWTFGGDQASRLVAE